MIIYKVLKSKMKNVEKRTHNTIRKKKIIALKTDLQHKNTWL